MIRRLTISFILGCSLLVGCITTKDGGNIVSPTSISTDVQNVEDPKLPEYTPWWIEE